MSLLMSGEPKPQDVIEGSRGQTRCRIPQRLPPGRSRLPTISNMPKPRANNLLKNKFEIVLPTSRFSPKNTRPRSDETRPRSANKNRDEQHSTKTAHPLARPAKYLDKTPNTQRKPPMKLNTKSPAFLPNQETIRKHEDMELRDAGLADGSLIYNDKLDHESPISSGDNVTQVKIDWQEKIQNFEQMKTDLKERQNDLLELYESINNTHRMMSSIGENTKMPCANDLQIMNVGDITPEQLLQMCANTKNNGDTKLQSDGNIPLLVDVKKLYNMPTKLVNTGEKTLQKRREIIDWLESLKSVGKGITMKMLCEKINVFKEENDALKFTLENVKEEFVKELEDVVKLMRKGVNDTVALQLRIEEMTYEISDLNSQNADLRKQIHSNDHMRSLANKHKVEELEKELKDEKCKKIFLKDRLARSEGQVKLQMDRVTQLEAALEQSQSHCWSLERSVQQLHDQNQKLQSDFDRELTLLTESIKEHTINIEEIAEAREKLQTEKENLEQRLNELSEHYNEAIENIKHENNLNVSTLLETEKKYEEELQIKKKLEDKVESLCAQLVDAELRLSDTKNLLQEKENRLKEALNTHRELESATRVLEKVQLEIEDYKNQLTEQCEAFANMEREHKQALDREKSLKCDLAAKDENISELKKKQSLLENQLQENEDTMENYVEQLTSLKKQIKQLQEDFGEFDNLNDLHNMINDQRENLLEATQRNGELGETLQKKDEELESYRTELSKQEKMLIERENLLKSLSAQEEEQANVIQILRNNLELRSKAENDFTQQLLEKSSQIDSLVINLEHKTQKISNLEKIILALEEQTRKASVQKKKDQDTISSLQQQITEYEAYQMDNMRTIETPAENLDSLIKILEDELGTSIDTDIDGKEHGYFTAKSKFVGESRRNKHERHQGSNIPVYQTDTESFPTKIVMGNFVKKTYIPTNDEYKGDKLDRKKAITNIDTHKWMETQEDTLNAYATPTSPKDNTSTFRHNCPGHQKLSFYTKNLQYLGTDHPKVDKKHRMFKLAGHRL